MKLCADLKVRNFINVPVVMMSAHWEAAQKGSCGPDDFIIKPFDLKQMLVKVNGHLKS